MRSNELRSERVRQGKSTRYMGNVIGKNADSYRKKERGDVKFTCEEIAAVSKDLDLDPVKLDVIFFDSNLQFSKQN